MCGETRALQGLCRCLRCRLGRNPAEFGVQAATEPLRQRPSTLPPIKPAPSPPARVRRLRQTSQLLNALFSYLAGLLQVPPRRRPGRQQHSAARGDEARLTRRPAPPRAGATMQVLRRTAVHVAPPLLPGRGGGRGCRAPAWPSWREPHRARRGGTQRHAPSASQPSRLFTGSSGTPEGWPGPRSPRRSR